MSAWAIDFSAFPEDTKKHITEWSQRTAVRTGFDEGRLIFVRKKQEKKAALYHNLRSVARNAGVGLPEGSGWLLQEDLVKAGGDNATFTSREIAKEDPAPADKSAFTPDVYKSLLPANYGEMVGAMMHAEVSA